jgi:hypothetical protein
MIIAIFALMIIATLVGVGYPLFSRDANDPALRPAANEPATALGDVGEGGFCTGCGRALQADDMYCPKCGRKRS